MATLTQTEIQTLVLQDLQSNTATDPPFTTAELQVLINDAYSMVWEMSGGGMNFATGATLWTPQPTSTTTGIVTGVLTSVNEIVHLFASASGASIGDPTAGDVELDRVELSQIQFLRDADGQGAYATPKLYALTRLATTTPASVGLWRLDVWPGVSGFHFPAHYKPQFTPLNGTTVTTPDVNDIESYDVGHLAAINGAPLVGRAELAPEIALKLSEKTRLGLDRRLSAMVDASQDR